jgi:C_GCAxxG_C_C family probable redox protein
MSRRDEAIALFERFNCAQSVLGAFGPDLGMPLPDCLRAAACFGAGLGRLGRTCGALTGALMVLGLRHGNELAEDPVAGRDSVYGRVQAFTARFEARFGGTDCRALTGCDLTTPEGRQAFKDADLHHRVCVDLVAGAVDLLEIL